MQVTGSIRIPFVVNGKDGDKGDKGDKGDAGTDGIMLVAPSFVNFAPSVTTLNFYVAGWRDGKQLVTATSQVTAPTEYGDGITAARVRGIDESKGVLCEITRTAGAVIDWTGDWSVTIEGIAYPFTVTATSVANGEKGDKGDTGEKGETGATGATGASGANGADAVTYELEASSNNLVWYPARGAYSPNTITLTYYKVTGSTRTEQNAYWSGEVVLDDGTDDGATYSIESTQAGQTNAISGTSTYVFRPANCSATVKSFRISAHVGSSEDSTAKEFSLQTTSSYGVRVQMWDDLPTGYEFENGTLGCSFLDFVVYGSDNNYYQCENRHTKTDSNYPTSTTATNSKLWTQISKLGNVATNVLLSNTAKINNLYVDDVYMESSGDKPTAVWISPAHEGMKIMKMGDDWQSGRENTNNNSGWANPTTWFHGGDIPDPSDIFKGGTDTTGNLPEWSVSQTNGLAVDFVSSSTVESSKSAAISVTALTLASVKISSQTVSISITDSAVSSSGTALGYSQINAELRLYDGTGSRYVVLASVTANGSGTDSTTTTTWTINVDTQFTPKNSSVYTCWAYTYLALRPGASVSISKSAASGVVSISYVNDGYVSQFGADGVFIGRNSNSYFRLLMGDSEQRHTLLANGYGLDVTQNGVLQYSGGSGNKMPVGGTLLLGHFTVSGSVKGTVWTFDGSTPGASVVGTGRWYLDMPDWLSLLGITASSHYCASITPISSESGATAQCYGYQTNSSGTFELRVLTCINGEPAFCDCFIRIDYIGIGGSGAQTMSVASVSAEEAQAELLEDKKEKEE